MVLVIHSGVSKPPAIFLTGPTATGKTALAVEMVQRLPLEIVSVDSAMVYRGMDVGTSKPTRELLAKAPHRLVDILDPAESYSAARFRTDALREMADIVDRGGVPLLVGGTGLYFRALERGLSPLPPADADVRRRLVEEARSMGWPVLHDRLQSVDPASASRIHSNDPQRIQRALEVYELTGHSMTDLFRNKSFQTLPYHVVKVVLLPIDRDVLHRRIADRFSAMLEQGLVQEVVGLRARKDLHMELPSMRAVGYRQVWEHLDGRFDLETMTYKGIVATRQLAKRQITWLRGEQASRVLDSEDEDLPRKTLKFLERALNAY